MSQAVVPPPQMATQRTPVTSFIFDVLRGAFLGDFAHDLHVPGAVTQAILGYVPVVGDIIAIRDLIHDIIFFDFIGICLNLIALVPVAGGVAKTIEVIRSARHVHQAYQRGHQKQYAVGAQPVQRHKGGGIASTFAFLFGLAGLGAAAVAALFANGFVAGQTSSDAVFPLFLGALPLSLLSLICTIWGGRTFGQRVAVTLGVLMSLAALAGVIVGAIAVYQGWSH
jgi:hypothetical protein